MHRFKLRRMVAISAFEQQGFKKAPRLRFLRTTYPRFIELTGMSRFRLSREYATPLTRSRWARYSFPVDSK